MRKIIVFSAGLILTGMVLGGSPARAELGCGCIKLGTAPTCVSGVSECLNKVGGLCLAPCDYQAPKKAMKVKKKKA